MPSLQELLAQGDLKQISDEATRRLSKNSQDGEALLALARVALVENNDSRVTTLLQRAAPRADPQEVALVRAALSAKRQDWKKAREIYQSLTAQEPIRPDALFGLSLCLLELEQYEEARELLERLVAQAPLHFAYHVELGRAYLFLGRTRAAARQFVRGLRLNRMEDRAWYLLVNLLLNQGRQRRANNLLRMGLALVPDSALLRGISNMGEARPVPAPPAPSAAPAFPRRPVRPATRRRTPPRAARRSPRPPAAAMPSRWRAARWPSGPARSTRR